MADAKLTIRVSANRGSSTVQYSTNGRYTSLAVNDIGDLMLLQPIPPTSGSKAMWESILNTVLADIIAGHGGGS
jgi:hypothetical protein